MKTLFNVDGYMYRLVSEPVYGKQDVGVTPGGPVDRTSFEIAKRLVSNKSSHKSQILEFTLDNTKITITKRCAWVVTGAKRDVLLNGELVKMYSTYTSEIGDVITFSNRSLGSVSYFMVTPNYGNFIHKSISVDYSKWYDDCIRVIKGPEYDLLPNPDNLFSNYWVTSNEMSNMGIKLNSRDNNVDLPDNFNMVSGPVADGTIQVTNKGPIVLMRHRQTVGGYARGYSVIDCDVDRLAQYLPNQMLKFKLITLDEAFDINKKFGDYLNEF